MSTRKTRAAEAPEPVADGSFAPVARAFESDRQVTEGKMFGSTALKVDGKVFAMLVKGKFVAKLPATRIAELIKDADAEQFDPGHGKLMKEWVALGGRHDRWVGLAKEARQFVLAGRP